MSDLASTPVTNPLVKKKSPEKLTLGTKLSAGVGESCINLGVNMPKEFAFVIYNLMMGVNAILLGFVLMLPRIWDAITDPIMGSISDNTRSRWGRRKPYMFIGGVTAALMLALICAPPSFLLGWYSRDESWTVLGYEFSKIDWLASGYFLFICLCFYTALTVFSVPYGALTMEMTSDYSERTRLMSYRTLFTYLSGILLGWALYATQMPYWKGLAESMGYEDPAKQGQIFGTWAVAGVMTLAVFVAAMIPTFALKERVIALKKAGDAQRQQAREMRKTPLLETLMDTLSMPPFVMVVVAYTIAFFGIIMVIHLGLYITIFYTHNGDKEMGTLAHASANTVRPAVALLAVFALNRLSFFIEKKIAWAICLFISLVAAVLTWFLYDPDLAVWTPSIPLGWVPFSNPFTGEAFTSVSFYFHPLTIPFTLLFPGLAATLMMSYSMIADVCDIDELESGTRREGMYWAVFNWIQKLAISGALLMTGFTLSFAQFDQLAPTQTGETLFTMRWLFTGTLVISIAIALVIVLLIPISKSRMEAVRAELDARREAEEAQG